MDTDVKNDPNECKNIKKYSSAFLTHGGFYIY